MSMGWKPAWLGVAMVVGCSGSPAPVEPLGADVAVLPMVVTRHVLAAEAAGEAAEKGLVAGPLRVEFPPDLDVDAGDLVAEYMTQANELGAHVTADLAITVVTADGMTCRTALEPEVATRTEHVPATTREVTVTEPVRRSYLRCESKPARSEDYLTYETRCATKTEPSGKPGTVKSSYECRAELVKKTRRTSPGWPTCSVAYLTGLEKRTHTEEVPAHDVTTTHRGFRALEPSCAPLEPGAEQADASAAISGMVYVGAR
jgi:hypothetical protein